MNPRFFVTSLALVLLVVMAANSVAARSPRTDEVLSRTGHDISVDAAADAPLQVGVGNTFTYQGRLIDGGQPANGEFSMQFGLYDVDEGGTSVNDQIELHSVAVENGLFTVPLNFGNVFEVKAFWLEVQVRASGESDYTVLLPRQQLMPTPYALASLNSWNLTGNVGTSADTNFLGTTDGQPLVFRAGNVERMRLNASGNVGIGVDSPAAKLEAVSSGGTALLGTGTGQGVIGRLGTDVPCPAGRYAVGGCGGSAGIGIIGQSDAGPAVRGQSTTGRGVEGTSGTGIGVLGDSTTRGVVGTLGGTSCAGSYAVGGCAGTTGQIGVYAFSASVSPLYAETLNGDIFIGVANGDRKVRFSAGGLGYFDGGTVVGGADYAESMPTSDDPAALQAGDVLALDPATQGAVRLSRDAGSRLIAGVYSTRPSLLAIGDHRIDDLLHGEVPVALLGRVPTKVSAENGPIAVGDLLVSAALPGHAMRASPRIAEGVEVYATGTILGKALASLTAGTGIIDVLVTLR